MKLLIVDDDAIDRGMIRRFLRASGLECDVSEAATVAEAKSRLAGDDGFDAILIDQRLPDGEGVQLLRWLGENDDRPPVPAILLTGQGSEAIAVQAMKSGAQDYLVKDQLSPHVLRHTVENVVELGRANAAKEQALSDHKRAEEELLNTRNFLGLVIENIPSMLFVKESKDLRFVLMNRAGEELLGFDRTELGGKNDYDFFPREQADFFVARDREALASAAAVDVIEEPVTTRYKGTRLLRTRKMPVLDGQGHPIYLLGLSEDVTDERRILDDLRRSEARLADAQRVAHVGSWERRLDTNELFWSDEVYRIHGLRKDAVDLSLDPGSAAIHPADRDYVESVIARRLNDPNIPPFSLDYRIVRPDGELRFVEVRGEVVFDDKGKADRIFGTIHDITERAQAQAALVDSEARTRMVMEAVPVGLVTTDDSGVIETFNAAAETIFGYARQEIIGREVFDLYAEPYRSHIKSRLAPYQRGETEEYIGAGPVMVKGLTKEGVQLPLELVASDLDVNGVHKYIAALQDVSQRQAAEEKLRQSQKMETVGQLTGGVAHDFNNVRLAMQYNRDLVPDRGAPDAAARDSVAAALKAVQRGAELTGRLLAFSRQQPLQPKVVNVNALVGETMRLLHRTLEESIDVETVLAAGVWPVEVDPGQFANALINLAVNARDAMPDGGKLTIETSNARLDDDYARQYDDVVPGQYVMVAVSDAGTGMTPEVIERAFDPFFTTKEVGKGTGLGLSMVYGFVKQSGGHVNIYSEIGHGTTIKLYFPRTLASREKEERRAVAATAGSRGETILLVEDDPDVRVTVDRILTALGYAVHTAANGPEALGLVDGGLRPDLLLADVVLPLGMNGPDVARAVTERVPECRTLFMSGYTDDAIIHHGRLDAGVMLLSKPFPREALAAKLREILDMPATPSA